MRAPAPQRQRRAAGLLLPLAVAVVLSGCGWLPSRQSATPEPTIAATPQTFSVHQGSPVPTRGAGPPPATIMTTQTSEGGLALIEQAISLLRGQYVAPPPSDALYHFAWDGVVRTMRRAGYSIEPEVLTLSGDPATDATLFASAYRVIAGAAGPEIDQAALAHAAIRAVTDGLDDCQTFLLELPEYLRQRGGDRTASYDGIGVSLRTQYQPVIISAVFPGSAAARAGVQPGDQLVGIDHTDVTTSTADEVAALLRGAAGTTVVLTIRRPGEQATRTIPVVRASITPPVVTSRIVARSSGQRSGYLAITATTGEAVESTRQALVDFARNDTNGIILDLRGNDLGNRAAFIQLASLFMPRGRVVARSVRGSERAALLSVATSAPPSQPLVVLIDSTTAGWAEVLAAALHDSGRGRLAGETSAGCAALSSTYFLTDGTGLQITIARLVSPRGRALYAVGQQPDFAVQADGSGQSDPILDEALRLLDTDE